MHTHTDIYIYIHIACGFIHAHAHRQTQTDTDRDTPRQKDRQPIMSHDSEQKIEPTIRLCWAHVNPMLSPCGRCSCRNHVNCRSPGTGRPRALEAQKRMSSCACCRLGFVGASCRDHFFDCNNIFFWWLWNIF